MVALWSYQMVDQAFIFCKAHKQVTYRFRKKIEQTKFLLQYKKAKILAKVGKNSAEKFELVEETYKLVTQSLQHVHAAKQQVLTFKNTFPHKPYKQSAIYLRYRYFKKKLVVKKIVRKGVWNFYVIKSLGCSFFGGRRVFYAVALRAEQVVVFIL